MAFRRLIGIRLFFVLVFGVLVLLVQMIALNRLNSQSPSSFPWVLNELDEEFIKRTAKPPLEHVRSIKYILLVSYLYIQCTVCIINFMYVLNF